MTRILVINSNTNTIATKLVSTTAAACLVAWPKGVFRFSELRGGLREVGSCRVQVAAGRGSLSK